MIDENKLINTLRFYFPRSYSADSTYLKGHNGLQILQRLTQIDDQPLPLTHFNQLLHLSHQAGVTEGFFRYYFLDFPSNHTYPVQTVLESKPSINPTGIASLEQLEWGVHRFFIDALLYYGNVRSAYRDFRLMSYEQLHDYFGAKRYNTERMRGRANVMPFRKIVIDDRYLISEMACKAYSSELPGAEALIETTLIREYKLRGGGSVTVGALYDKSSPLATNDPQSQLMLELAADEFFDQTINSEEELRGHIAKIKGRFESAREAALSNTDLYLSIVNELDVYVATSMRTRDDFRSMARNCEFIFKQSSLKDLKIRYFDPTMSAAGGHEDKGLIECLMVKCAKALLYFAGDKDSFGKDAEVAMAMSLGKPVIIFCPSDVKGTQRVKFFRDIHPLSRLIQFDTGVACGATVTQDVDTVVKLLERIFTNSMEYNLQQKGDGYFRVRERLTNSVVRLQTASDVLRETFWNYYHGIP